MNSQTSSILASLGRVLLGTLFLLSGFGKIAAPSATKAYISMSGLPFPDLAYLGAIVIEVGFGLALVLGYRTRWVAAVMGLFTVVTAFTFHINLADPNQFINFFKNISVAGGLLQVVAFGAGTWSLDAWRSKSAATA